MVFKKLPDIQRQENVIGPDMNAIEKNIPHPFRIRYYHI